ncbi:MAG: 1-acyl-sn-glycerol-3-phosphate acyltransferase [Clostridia bacterium]|nr:1-acyl-sn-glycerol-3-phosphate acyltransferase [Clostridia bacterium]
MFDPNTEKYPYPKRTDGHYIVIKKDKGAVFDSKYPFIDDSKKAKFLRALVRILLYAIVFPFTKIKLGLRTEGRENLVKHKKTLNKGVISCSNHVHFFDYLAVMRAIKPKKPAVLVWARNINGESGGLIRSVGGIPIPENNPGAALALGKALEKYLDGGWLHVYPEGSMWEFYAPIRPFKRGAAFYACRCDKPLLPMAFSYRKPGWIRRVIFRQIACLTLRIGEPLFPNKDLPEKERILDLTARCHAAVCALAGFFPGENIYPPVFDDNRRIDY